MTRSVSSDGLDLACLSDYLCDRLPGFEASQPLEADLLPGGRSNLTYRVRQADRLWALRRPPLGHVMESAHDVAREYRVMAGLARVGFPVPRMDLLCEDPGVLGAPFMLMEYVQGRVLTSQEQVIGSPVALNAADADVVVDTLAQLHDISPADAGLATLGRPAGYLERQINRWTMQWNTTKTRTSPAVEALINRLRQEIRMVPPQPATLVHGDFRIDNLILDNDHDKVLAVLDWEMATLGDPLADLAIALVYWEEPGDGMRKRIPVGGAVTTAPGFPTRAAVAQRYAERRNVALDAMNTYVALACLKLGVIMESIHYRFLAGLQRGVSAEGEDMAAACDAFIEIGLQAARTDWESALRA